MVTEGQATPFEREVREQLDRIEALLAKVAAVRQCPQPDDEPEQGKENSRPDADWLCRWYNDLWEAEPNQSAVLARIRRQMADEREACVIDFRDRTQAMIERGYAEFTCDESGRMFVLPMTDAQGEANRFIALPYPVTNVWFDRGITQVSRMYTIAGNEGFLSPQVYIHVPAVLERVSDQNREPYFKLIRTGSLRVSRL